MDSYKNIALPPEERARLLLKELTLREKVGQVNQRIYGFTSYTREGNDIRLSDELINEVERWGGLGMLYGLHRADPWSKKDFSTGLDGVFATRMYNEVQRYVIEHSRHGIPALMCGECPHGHQALDGYLLPVNLALGATWNPTLVGEGFTVCAQQMADLHIDMALVSMLDVLRDPRWGRSEECYSEDPYLVSKMAEAVTSGFLAGGMDVVAKHCCAQGETTGGVNASAARIGERELREIHLPAVESAVKAGALGVMAAYNEIDGIPCHTNEWLLRQVLRDEYGFKGIVMADGRAIDRLGAVAGSREAMGAEALRASVDISLWDEGFTTLETAINEGLVEESLLDEAVLRVLTLKFKRGLFEHPYIEETAPKRYDFKAYPQTLELARQSVVLLKNKNDILPLTQSIKSLAVIGPFADDVYAQLGDYTPPQRAGEVITVLDGIRAAAPAGTTVYEMTEPFPTDESAQDEYIKKAVEKALLSETVIAVLGGSSSRFQEMVFDTNGAVISQSHNGQFLSLTDCGEGVDVSDLQLPAWQYKLLEALRSTNRSIITVLIAGRPYAMEQLTLLSDVLCCVFYPGPAGGQAIAEVLWGAVCPSGRLPVSLPRTTGQLPVYYNHKASYAMRYSDCPPNTAYPFGFGLSYVPFELTDVSGSAPKINIAELEKEGYTLSFKVKNNGAMKASVTPQLYIRDRMASVMPRVRMLKAFTRVTLAPGEETGCTLNLTADDLKVWNREMAFVTEEGTFDLFLHEGEKMWWQGTLEVTATN